MRHILAILALLCACAISSHAQVDASGHARGDIYIQPPYQLCFGDPANNPACASQSGPNAAWSSLFGGAGVPITNVAGLSSYNTTGDIAVVTNGSSTTDCTTGRGSTVVVCQYSGSAWSAVSTAGASGVTSFSGDGALLSNTGSTGSVTAALANTGLAYAVWGGIASSSGAPAYHSLSSYPTAAFPTLNQSTTGNAATATALASAPSQCTNGQFATGVAASGNANCDANLDDGHTAANTLSYSGSGGVSAPNGPLSSGTSTAALGSGHGLACAENTSAGTPTSGIDYIRCDGTAHNFKISLNGGAETTLPPSTLSCTEIWGGTNTGNALQSGDDAVANNGCYNDSGATRTITAVKCRDDNASNTSTVNPTFGSAGTGTTILSGALTCGSSYAYSATGTVSSASWTTGTGIDPAMGGTLTGTSIAMIVEYHY